MSLSTAELLPAPFAWVEIPAGNVTLTGTTLGALPAGKVQAYIVPAFAISKYLITNAQYACFIEAGGYSQRDWWSMHGWSMLKRGRTVWSNEERDWVHGTQSPLEPAEWHNSALNQPNHPVVGICWHEVAAYCRWLTETTGEAIWLPAEPQWQRAAQGDTNQAYPWGDTFDEGRCYKVPGQTCAVTDYEGKSDSPFGVVDMVGNVSEWCDGMSVIREGGRLTVCGRKGNPFVAKSDLGFRIARVKQFPRIAV